ncbi:Superoxide dismutase [Mn], mitochondrial [Tritrichomonas musculus]|uniref:Superoxide dismutase n=1 Tax=Tritrichomonas musculus TaxID=1915356 RepID=A0ABR2H079_9EUKA
MFSIEKVPYIDSGLPGFLTAHAVQIHVQKHHQGYVDTANKIVPTSEFHGKPIEFIIQHATGPVFNNVAQHYNHSFFWKCLTAQHQEIPPSVANFLTKNFGGVDKFKEQFVQKASTIFGSGWCYLAKNQDGTVSINQYSNAANPVKDQGIPLLCIDTWEHSWYIDYENRKAEYFNKFWDVVNWKFVEQNLSDAKLVGLY